jgi:hypothetical protein
MVQSGIGFFMEKVNSCNRLKNSIYVTKYKGNRVAKH